MRLWIGGAKQLMVREDALVLKRIFERLNSKFFGSRLKARLEWSSRLRVTAGKCLVGRNGNIIRISTRYVQKFPDRLEQLVLHEMIHLVAPGHGARFKAEARRCGVEPDRDFLYCQAFSEPRPWKYLYTCPVCGMSIKRRRKGTWYCRRCYPTHGRRARLRISKSYGAAAGD